MARPIAYFYETKNTLSGTTIYDVHAMGNPILWWLATGSIIPDFALQKVALNTTSLGLIIKYNCLSS